MAEATQLTIEQRIDALTKQGATIMEAVEKLAESPVYKSMGLSARAMAGGMTAVSYFENEQRGQTVNMIPGVFEAYRKSGMVAGYKGAKEAGWDSLGSFIKSGFKESKDPGWAARHGSIFKTIQGLNVTSAEEGAFLIPPEYAPGMLDRVYENDLWNQTDNYSIAGNNLVFTRNAETSRATGSRYGGIQGYWLGEGATMTKSAPKVKQVGLRLKKLCVLVYLTNELIEDGGPVATQYVERAAADEFNFMLGDAVINGTGVGQPLGVMNSGALLSIAKEAGQAAATIVSQNVDKMFARRLLSGAKKYAWYHNQDCGPQLDVLAQDIGTGGIALYRPADGLASAAPQGLKGLMRKETEFNATVGTQGDLLLCDLGHVLSISKSSGVSQEQSIHVEFLTDQTALRFIMRVDARPWEDTPVTPYKGTNTQSAFIALDTRS